MSVIYGICDPRPGHISGVRYVGMSIHPPHKRLKEHCSRARNPASRHTHKERWLGGILDDGAQPLVVMLAYTVETDLDILGVLEIEWISRLRDMGFPLVNIAPGGEGRRGPMSDESKRRMSIAGKGRWKSAETRARMSIAQKGKPRPELIEYARARPRDVNGRFI